MLHEQNLFFFPYKKKVLDEDQVFRVSPIPSVVHFDRSADKTLKTIQWESSGPKYYSTLKTNGLETVFTQKLLVNFTKSYKKMANKCIELNLKSWRRVKQYFRSHFSLGNY